MSNGGFETGDLAGWTNLYNTPPPAIDSATAHTGSRSAYLGGDVRSGISQTIVVPDQATLTFWIKRYTQDSIYYDSQNVQVQDAQGNILKSVVHDCSTTGWTLNTVDLSAYAGQTVKLAFFVLGDDYGDVTTMWVDDVSVTGGVVTLPGAPAALTATPGNQAITLAWTAPSGGHLTYSVYRGTDPGSEDTAPVATGVAATDYTDTGLVNGTAYYYTVKAANSAGAGPTSGEASATPVALPDAPSSLSATAISSSQINLSWTASTGAGSYQVERIEYDPDGGTEWAQLALPTDTSYQDTGLVAGTSYYYRVRAANAGGTSDPSPSASATTLLVAPANLRATANGRQISLAWTGSQGAASYTVQRSTISGGPYTAISTAGAVTGVTYADTDLTSGTTYYYTVVAVNSTGTSPQSSEASATFILVPAPTGLTAQPGNQQVALSWAAVSGATGYTLKGSATSGGPYTDITYSGAVTGTSFTNQYLTNGETYYFVVTAVNGSSESANSNEVSAVPVGPPLAPTDLTAQPGYQQVTLTWTASTVTMGYNVYRGTSPSGEGATPVNAAPIMDTGFTDAGLTTGTTYYYTVTAINTYGASPQSGEASATLVLPPDTPASLTATPGAGQVTLSWTAPLGLVTGYTVQRATSTGGPYTTLATGPSTTYTDATVVNGTPYFYVVSGYNISGSGAASDEAMAEPFVSPAAPPVTPNYGYDSGGMRAWKQVAGNTTYFLYDGSKPICELDGSGNVTATNTWGGGLLSRRAATSSTFYTLDPQGNVAQRLDGTGSVLGTYAFDAFGLRTGTDATTDPYSGFGGGYGYYADAETGLSLLGHRYYDTGTGRFINRDPVGYVGGSDLYAYCGNNPIMGYDPLGFWNLYKWIYTSDGNASDEIYNGALQDFADQVPTRSPDYYSMNVAVPGALSKTLGGTVQLVFDRYGYVYAGAGVAGGTPGNSYTAMAGWLDQGGTEAPSEADLNDFIGTQSWNVSATFGVGTGITWSPVGDDEHYHIRKAYEFGFGNLQAGASATYSWPIGRLPWSSGGDPISSAGKGCSTQ